MLPTLVICYGFLVIKIHGFSSKEIEPHRKGEDPVADKTSSLPNSKKQQII